MDKTKLGTFEAITLILSFVVAHTVLSLPKALVDVTKSSTLLNILYITVLAVIFVYLICFLFKKFPGMDILDISEYLGGKIFKNIVGFIFIFYFVISACIFLRNFAECLEIVYYPSTDIIFIVLFFIISIPITSKLNFNASLRANLIIVPLVLMSIVFLFFANIRYFTPQRIFPILGNGFKDTFIVGLTNIYSFSGIALIYFLPPLLKEPSKLTKLSVTGIIISSIYLLFVVSLILFMFPVFVSLDEVLPLYTIATYVEFGSFFQRLESVFLLIWLISFACYLSIIANFSFKIFKKITLIKDTKPIIYPFAILALGIALLPKNYAISKMYETKIYPYIMIGIVFFVSLALLLIAYIKKRKGEKLNE
ncbi:MAG: endospore germination permease [Clostridia bacterium]|nr:endospore germination permease [Clostridia bacterium]